MRRRHRPAKKKYIREESKKRIVAESEREVHGGRDEWTGGWLEKGEE